MVDRKPCKMWSCALKVVTPKKKFNGKTQKDR